MSRSQQGLAGERVKFMQTNTEYDADEVGTLEMDMVPKQEVMAYASLVIPFVLAYIFYAWRKLDFHKFNEEEMKKGNHY